MGGFSERLMDGAEDLEVVAGCRASHGDGAAGHASHEYRMSPSSQHLSPRKCVSKPGCRMCATRPSVRNTTQITGQLQLARIQSISTVESPAISCTACSARATFPGRLTCFTPCTSGACRGTRWSWKGSPRRGEVGGCRGLPCTCRTTGIGSCPPRLRRREP